MISIFSVNTINDFCRFLSDDYLVIVGLRKSVRKTNYYVFKSILTSIYENENAIILFGTCSKNICKFYTCMHENVFLNVPECNEFI